MAVTVMDLNFYAIERAPKDLPVWQLILDDLGDPPASRVAKTLGVEVSEVERWGREGCAPRYACLALFWLTRWGRSQMDADAVNDARIAYDLACAMESEVDRLKGQLVRVLRLVNDPAANGPLMDVPQLRRAAAVPELP